MNGTDVFMLIIRCTDMLMAVGRLTKLNNLKILSKRDVGEKIHSPASATICSNTAIRS